MYGAASSAVICPSRACFIKMIPTRRIHFLAQHLVRRAGRQAEAAVDASRYGLCHRRTGGAEICDGNVVLHGELFRASHTDAADRLAGENFPVWIENRANATEEGILRGGT